VVFVISLTPLKNANLSLLARGVNRVGPCVSTMQQSE
jgi:hypothetical protein